MIAIRRAIEHGVAPLLQPYEVDWKISDIGDGDWDLVVTPADSRCLGLHVLGGQRAADLILNPSHTVSAVFTIDDEDLVDFLDLVRAIRDGTVEIETSQLLRRETVLEVRFASVVWRTDASPVLRLIGKRVVHRFQSWRREQGVPDGA